PAAAPRPLPKGEAPRPVESAPSEFTFADIFTRRVEEKSAITAVYLQKAERVERVGDNVQVVLGNATTLAMLQSKEHKSALDAVATELVGKPVSVSLIMKEQKSKGGVAADTAKDEPLVKSFLEVFRGDIAQVKPAKGE